MKPKVFAIDFDGVVHDHLHPLEGRKMGAPIEGAKDALTLMKKGGHTVIIFSIKATNSKVIEDFMTYYNIPYDDITNIKPNADYFIDDHAVKFTSWKELRAHL